MLDGSVTTVLVVGGGRVATVLLVGGTKVDDVGGAWVVVVVSGSVVVVVAGGGVAGGAVVPGARGVVVATGGAVFTVVDGLPATVVDVGCSDGGTEDDVGVAAGRAVVEVGRAVVDGDWVATCWGELSPPVATSKRRATRAIDARA